MAPSKRFLERGTKNDTTFKCDECSIKDFESGAHPWRKSNLDPELLVCHRCLKALKDGKPSEAYKKMAEAYMIKKDPPKFSPPERKLIELMSRAVQKKLTRADRKRLESSNVRSQARKVLSKLKEAGKTDILRQPIKKSRKTAHKKGTKKNGS